MAVGMSLGLELYGCMAEEKCSARCHWSCSDWWAYYEYSILDGVLFLLFFPCDMIADGMDVSVLIKREGCRYNES